MSTETRKDVFYSDTLVRFSHCDPAGIIFYPHYFVMFNGLVEDWCNHALEINRSEERRVGKECRSRCDWSSDVCSSDLSLLALRPGRHHLLSALFCDVQRTCGRLVQPRPGDQQIGRASCRERV